MKVMHILSSKIYSGAEKVVCQIIKSFREDEGIEMVYCSPENENVRYMVGQQGIELLGMEKMCASEIRRFIAQEKPDLIHAHDMRASFNAALACGRIPSPTSPFPRVAACTSWPF